MNFIFQSSSTIQFRRIDEEQLAYKERHAFEHIYV